MSKNKKAGGAAGGSGPAAKTVVTDIGISVSAQLVYDSSTIPLYKGLHVKLISESIEGCSVSKVMTNFIIRLIS
jgi:hypothetical protein